MTTKPGFPPYSRLTKNSPRTVLETDWLAHKKNDFNRMKNSFSNNVAYNVCIHDCYFDKKGTVGALIVYVKAVAGRGAVASSVLEELRT